MITTAASGESDESEATNDCGWQCEPHDQRPFPSGHGVYQGIVAVQLNPPDKTDIATTSSETSVGSRDLTVFIPWETPIVPLMR